MKVVCAKRVIGGIAAKLRACAAKFCQTGLLATLFGASSLTSQALAQETPEIQSQLNIFGLSLRAFELTQFALLAGSMLVALVSALWLIRERARIADNNTALHAKVSTLTKKLTQMEAVSSTEGQMVVIWPGDNEKPVIVGFLDPVSGAPEIRAHLFAFGRWLAPKSAAILEHAIDDLRSNAKVFNEVIETSTGAPIEVIGRTSGGSAIVRFSSLSGEREAYARLMSSHEQTSAMLDTMKLLMDEIAMPVWLRDKQGSLAWVNTAYAKAVGYMSKTDILEGKTELFGEQALRSISHTCAQEGLFQGMLTTVIDGDRIKFDVLEKTGHFGSAGIGVDKTETEAVRHELSKTIRSHEETLDELTTAVAMFNESEKLQFYNLAFAKLWNLDAAFLEQAPNISMFLDRLRTEGQLPEQPEWRRWKDELLSAFRATESKEHWWHLTDGRTIRVIANPHPKGGLTWVFENLTERIDLESRFKTMVRVQGETLDNLAEGVSVFGADGKLQLANPAFKAFWRIDDDHDKSPMHISDITRHVNTLGLDSSAWEEFTGIVTGFDEDRATGQGRAFIGEKTLSWMTVPLPNGQTMITFVDMTAADQIERALRDRNEALERTARLKNRFIHHVSYELRSPLTSIMGFTDLIAMEQIGTLNDKQREYVGHIEMSSRALLETTDDILDLASVDAGVIELSFDNVEINAVMQEAAESLKERFEEHQIELAMNISADAGEMVADRARLLQIMRNVLANAANFAPEKSVVNFTCERVDESIIFKIRDKGPGIASDVIDDIFERFHTQGTGRRRGAGLGLTIVKSFVDLHEGEIIINSGPSLGTEVILKFPQSPSRIRVAAE